MDKIFGLSLFCSLFVVGIVVGKSRRPITPGLAVGLFLGFLVFYTVMGLVLVIDSDFLRPS